MVDFRYVANISPVSWKASSDEERVETLQDLENQNATEQNREPCSVTGAHGDEYSHGRYSREHKTIFVSADLIRNDDPREAMRTVIHEGQHDYQVDSIEYPDNHPEMADDVRSIFALNRQNYQESGDSAEEFRKYESQPLEVDARAAEDRFSKQYEATFGQPLEQKSNSERRSTLDDSSHESTISEEPLTAEQQAKLNKLDQLAPPPPSANLDKRVPVDGNPRRAESETTASAELGETETSLTPQQQMKLDRLNQVAPPPPPQSQEPTPAVSHGRSR